MSQHSKRKLSKLKLNQIKIGSQKNQITKFLTPELCIKNDSNEINSDGQLTNDKRLNNNNKITTCVPLIKSNESIDEDIDLEEYPEQPNSKLESNTTVKDDSLCHFQTPDKRLLRKRPILNYTNNNNKDVKKKRSAPTNQSNKRKRSKQQDIRKIIEKQKQLTADELYENLLIEYNSKEKKYINREQFDIELAIKQSKINPFIHDDEKVNKLKINLEQFKFGNGNLNNDISINPFFNLKHVTKQKWSKSITPLTRRNPLIQQEKLHKHINAIIINNSKSTNLPLTIRREETQQEFPLEPEKKFTCSSYYLKQFHSMDNRIFAINSMGDHHQRTKDCIDKFYINDGFTPSTIKCGSLLKNWNAIPGREKSPIRDIQEIVNDDDEICENVNTVNDDCCVPETPVFNNGIHDSECNSSKKSLFDRSSSCELFDDSVMLQDDCDVDGDDKVPDKLTTNDRLCVTEDNVLETDQELIDGDSSSISSSCITASNKHLHKVIAEIHSRLESSEPTSSSDILIDLTNDDDDDDDHIDKEELNKSQKLNSSPVIRKSIETTDQFENQSIINNVENIISSRNSNKTFIMDTLNEISINQQSSIQINQQNEIGILEKSVESNENENCVNSEDEGKDEIPTPITPNLLNGRLSLLHQEKFNRLMMKSKKLIDYMNLSATPSPSSSPFRQRNNSDDLPKENNSIELFEHREKKNSIQINDDIIDLTDESEILPAVTPSKSISNLINSKLLNVSTDNLPTSISPAKSTLTIINDELTAPNSFEIEYNTDNQIQPVHNQSLRDILEQDEELFKKCTIHAQSSLKRTISDISLLQPSKIANKKLKTNGLLTRNQSFIQMGNAKENLEDKFILDELPLKSISSTSTDDPFEDSLENELQFIKDDIDNEKFFIKTGRCVTPKPNYGRMSSPERFIELKKYGIKIQKKRQAIICLEHIYNQLHPYIELPKHTINPIDVKEQQNPINIFDHEFDSFVDVDGNQLKNVSDKINNSNSWNSEKYCDSIDGDDDAEQYLIKSQTNVLPTNSSIAGSLQIGTGHMLLNDKLFLRLHNQMTDGFILPVQPRSKKISWCLLPLHIAWHNLLSANPQLFENILQYKPIDLKEIRNFLKKIHLRFESKDLVSFFDQHCIAFRNENKAKIK